MTKKRAKVTPPFSQRLMRTAQAAHGQTKLLVARAVKATEPVLDKIVTLDNGWQGVHFLASMFIVEHFGRWCLGWLGTNHWVSYPEFWLVLVVALSGFKEAVIDTRYESAEVAGNGWKDWSSFVVGALAGFLLA